MSHMQSKIHIYPVNRKTGKTSHITKKHLMCWCNPEVKQPCPEGEPNTSRCVPGCWRCGGEGLVEPHCQEWALLVIHNEDKGPCYPEGDDQDLGAK